MCTGCSKSLLDAQWHDIVHSNVKVYPCPTCKKMFTNKSDLKRHLLIHTKEPSCSCYTCGKIFIRQDCLVRHLRSKHANELSKFIADAKKKELEAQQGKVKQNEVNTDENVDNVDKDDE